MFIKYIPNGRRVDLFDDNGSIIRRFNSRSNIINAVINGDGKTAIIAITEKNGKTTIYNKFGHVIRRK